MSSLESILIMYERDLKKLMQNIQAYPQESLLWQKITGLNTTAGNLALHLVGNLNTYIGKNLGNLAYERQRLAEFNTPFVTQTELLDRLKDCHERVIHTLKYMDENQLQNNYPEKILETPATIEMVLLHLLCHLSYHTGQINFHFKLTHSFFNP